MTRWSLAIVALLILAAPAWAQEQLTLSSVTATDTATAVLAQSTFPALHVWDTNSSADEKRWALIANGDSFWLRALDDAWTATVSNPLEIQRTGITIDKINLSATVTGSSDYVSQATGWGITDEGGGDFRYLFADEMHVRTFIADLEQALAGLQIITKSVAVLSDDFTCPAASGTATLRVDDLPGAADMQVFDASDWVSVRSFARASQTLTIGDCVGQVSAPNTTPSGYQEWTFTRGAGGSAGSMTASTVVARGTVVLDYGVSGAGYYEVNAVDGTDAVNSPYAQVVTWATAPVAANRTVRGRFGNLLGITGVSGEYGILAGTYATDSTGQYFRASNQAVELRGVDFLLYDGSTNVFRIDRGGGTAPYLSLGSPAPTTYGSGDGIWMGDNSGAYAARVGNPSGNRWAWDGTDLIVVSAGLTIDSTGITLVGNTTDAWSDATSYRFTLADHEAGISAGTHSAGSSLYLQNRWSGSSSATPSYRQVNIYATDDSSAWGGAAAARIEMSAEDAATAWAKVFITTDGTATTTCSVVNECIGLQATEGIFNLDTVFLAGELRLTADVASPGAGSIAQTATNGLQLRGVTGSSYDLTLTNNAGTAALAIITGGTEIAIAGVASDGTGSVVCVKSDTTLGTCSTSVDGSGNCTCG